MLVDPDECAVDEDIFEIGIIAEGLENALPDSLLRPSPEARIDPEPLAKVSDRSRANLRAIQRTASINNRLSRPLLPGSPTLPDSSGNQFPLRVAQRQSNQG